MKLVIAFLCSALSFPLMLFERFKPMAPTPLDLIPSRKGGWFHRMKNIWTETIDADAQWWSKGLAFTILVLLIWGLLT